MKGKFHLGWIFNSEHKDKRNTSMFFAWHTKPFCQLAAFFLPQNISEVLKYEIYTGSFLVTSRRLHSFQEYSVIVYVCGYWLESVSCDEKLWPFNANALWNAYTCINKFMACNFNISSRPSTNPLTENPLFALPVLAQSWPVDRFYFTSQTHHSACFPGTPDKPVHSILNLPSPLETNP